MLASRHTESVGYAGRTPEPTPPPTTYPMFRLSPHRLAGDWLLFIAFGTFFAVVVSHG